MSDIEDRDDDTLARVQERIVSALQLARVRNKMFGVEPTWPTIERYSIREQIGEGGMGAVFKAYDPKLDREVAIKLLNAEHGRAMQDRLLREAQAMAKVPHNHVVRVHDVVLHQGVLCLVMEYIEGTTLRQWQRDCTLGELLDAYAQAGRGLAQIHSAGLVHRDFKPDNVFVERGGRVVVGDLGLAAAAAAADAEPAPRAPDSMLDHKMTRTGATMGTPGYMSPAQILGRKVDARSDQFSFCVALYEAVYKVHPFAGDTTEDIAAAVVRGRMRPRPEGARVPAWLHGWLARGLAPDPDDRYADMNALLRELARLRGRRRRVMFAMTAVVALAAMVLLGYRMAPASVPPDPCAEFDRAGIWDQELRSRLKSHITGASDRPAMNAWQHLERAVDRVSERWRGESKLLCHKNTQANWGPGDRVRHDCLDHVRRQIQMDGDHLAADEALDLKRVYDLAGELDRNDVCKHTSSEPPDEAEVRKVAAIRDLIIQAKALESRGEFSAAEGVAREAVLKAENTYIPVRAEAMYRLGHILGSQARGAEAERELQRAAELAYATRNIGLARDIEIYRAKVAAEDLFDARLAMKVLESAHNALLQSGDAPVSGLETVDNERRRDNLRFADYLEARGLAAHADGNADQAVAKHREALDIRRRLALNSADLDVSKSLNNLANALANQARALDERAADADEEEALTLERKALALKEEALALYDEAIAMRGQLLGPEHPLLAEPLFNSGDELRKQGKLDEARQRIEQALTIEVKEYGDGSNEALLTLVGLAVVELTAMQDDPGKKDRVREVCGRIATIHSSLPPERRKEMSRVSEHMLLAACYRAVDASDPAIVTEYESALEIARAHAPDAGESASVYLHLLRILDEIYMAAGRRERACQRWREAISVLRNGDEDDLKNAKQKERERCEQR